MKTDPNINYNILEKLIVNTLNMCIPIKKTKFNKHKHKKSSWITAGIIKSIKFRDNLYRSAKQISPDCSQYAIMKKNLSTYNKILKRLLREAKVKFYNMKFVSCKNDPKLTWKTINFVLNKAETKQYSDYMIINNNKTTNKQLIADTFNSYFQHIGAEMASSIPINNQSTYKEFLFSQINSTFSFQPIKKELVKDVINGLKSKNSSSQDGISTIILKKIEPLISESLALIINQSFYTVLSPDKLKLAKVIPIHKKNETSLVENYRPISILPAISKVFEKVAHLQVFSYFQNNNFLFNSQCGFREGHSAEHALLEIVDRVSSGLDGGCSPIAIFLDLSKAFDTINYDILLSKLDYYGIRGTALGWFRSYLSERRQYVVYDDVTSNTVTTLLGVPQGSILGPLLFIIYLNYIQNSTKFFNFINYADDTNLVNSMVTHDFTQVNNEINKVYQWLCANKLSLNIKKTESQKLKFF